MKKRKLWQCIGVAILLLLLLSGAIATYIFWPISEDLSHLADAGEPYNARILRDIWGVPHIFGITDADAAYGLAFAHAEDDFVTIQRTVLAARGQLASVFGREAVQNDYMIHLFRIWDTIEAKYETHLSAEVRAILEAYAAGLNHFAALHEDEALPGLFPVSGKDIVAGTMFKTAFFVGLPGYLSELFADERQRAVSPRLDSAPRLDGSNACLPWQPGRYCPFVAGSNVFAVGPGRTANGETFLAINPHQPWEGPLTWYEAHIHSEDGWDAVGALFPGAPMILIGHNRDIGWGFAVNDPDLVDIFVLDINPDNPNQYSFDGQWLELEVRQAPIRVRIVGRLSITVEKEVLWSIHGPVVRRDHGTYAIRYAGMGQIGLLEQFYRINRASGLDEFRDAMRMGQLPSFHVVYADGEGNIAYFYNGFIPIRSERFDWTLYLPGDTSETLWTEYVPFDNLPQVINPPSGFIQNANSTPFITTFGPGNPDSADFSPTLGIETRVSNRSLRLLELFQANESVTAEDFHRYKFDLFYSTESDVPQWIDQVVNATLPDEPDVQQAVTTLRDWDLQTNPESTGATLFVVMLYEIFRKGAVPLAPDAFTNTPIDTQVLVEAFIRAVALLDQSFGRVDVPWSEVNRLRRGDVDLGLGGGPDILHAIYGVREEDGRLRVVVGDSYVMLVTWDAAGNVSSRSIHQFGSATQDKNSPHYADQAPLLAKRQLKPVWMDEADIRANLKREYRPGE